MSSCFRQAMPVCLFIIFFLFSSCSPQTENRRIVSSSDSYEVSIKAETLSRKDKLAWTEELKKSEELSDVSLEPEHEDFFSEELRISTDKQDPKLFPSMQRLGSMDISSMSSAIHTKLTAFLSGVKSKSIKSDDSVFAEKYIGVVFLYELSFYPNIDSWYIGSPFIAQGTDSGMGDSYEIPILFLTARGKFNCWIILDPSKAKSNEFKIKQIVLGELS